MPKQIGRNRVILQAKTYEVWWYSSLAQLATASSEVECLWSMPESF
jgi:hypothetical protein